MVQPLVADSSTSFRAGVGSHYKAHNGVTKKYYFAGRVRLAERKDAVLYFPLADHLGSTAVTADGSGNWYSELRYYYPFGDARYTTGQQVTPYRFTGQRLEHALKLYDYGARW